MHYLLKGILLSSALLYAGPWLSAIPPEQAPISLNIPPGQLDGESYILQITQTPQGQVIVGGERVAFYQDTHWRFVPGLHKAAIRSLLVDGNTLWVASPGEIGRIRLPLDEHSTYEALPIPELSGSGEIWHLAKSGDVLVATTGDDVWLISPPSRQASRIHLPNQKHLLLQQWDDRIVISQPGEAIWQVQNGKLEALENPLSDKKENIWVWSNSQWILTLNALYKRENNGAYRPVITTNALINRAVVTSGTQWGKYLAIATYTRGLALFDTELEKVSPVTRATGLSTLALTSVFADSAGRLWVGSSQGLTLFDSLRFGHVLAPNRNPLFALRAGGLFVAYEDHADFFHDDGREETVPQRVYEFIPTRSGPVLGLWEKVRVGTTEIPTTGNRVGVSVALPGGSLLVTAGQRVHLVDPVAMTATQIVGPPAEITGLTIIGDALWAAALDGNIYRAGLAPPLTFTKAASLRGKGTTKLYHLGETLIAISNDGVSYGDRFSPVADTAGLRSPHVAENADGLWLVGEQDGERRLGRLRAMGDAVRWETVEAKGLAQLSEIHSLTGSGHTLTLCGDSTILEFNSDQLAPATRVDAPQLAFTYREPQGGATATLPAAPTELGADQDSLAFSGTLPFDEFGERPRFERRLLPTESAWVPTKLGETVSYPSLSPRTYTLEVRATRLGHTGPVAAHTFTVLPPWWATRSAAAGYLGLAALGFYGVYRLRTRQIRRRTAELERIVEERTHALKEASAAKTEFLASMSHEIRNPMNGVLGLVEILRELPATARQADTLRLLHHCAEQLRSTVDDILDFSKIEAGTMRLDAVKFDLLDTLEAAAATIDAPGEKISFLDKPPRGIALVGDVGKLRQIFANYLSNAIKYGVPPAARVSTLLTPIPDDGVRLTLGVASSGPTIAKDTLDKFFESFTRGDEAIERNIHGTGLGLAICRRFALAMGGEVGAVSANGETTFYLNVPFARADAEAPAPAIVPAPNALPAKALAIEDEDYNRIVLGSILAKMNYTVDWATTGAEALKLAQENGYDIILTDYRLPDTNGVELTKKILKFVSDPKPAVFAVTAYSTKERRDECLNAGMSGFISKPITLEKLRSTLAGWGEKNLAKISLEASRFPTPVLTNQPPPEIIAAWDELVRTVPTDAKKAANLAHTLNNLCRAHGLIDAAEQFELLEGALERGEPTGQFLQACEGLLHS